MKRGYWLLAAYLGLLLASHVTILVRGYPELPPPGAVASSPHPGDVTDRRNRPRLPAPEQACIDAPGFRADGPAAGEVRLCFWRYRHSTGQAENKNQESDHGASSAVPTIIALHGSPGQAADQGRVARFLQNDYNVLAVDMPGFGASSAGVPDYGVRAYARYINFLIEQEAGGDGPEDIYIFAHSLGGGTAIELSRIAPRRLRGAIMYGAIGIQSGEGSGDYYIEHGKYRLGYALLMTLPELIPHFGYLGDRALRKSFLRNFMDTDQRPLRRALENFNAPLLIIHGAHDPLVPAWAAREHHEIVRHSEFVLLNRSHFMVFNETGARRLAEYSKDFIERNEERLQRPDPLAPERRTFIEAGIPAATDPPLDLGLDPTLSAWTKLGAIILGTFVSEDLTCISVGLLARDNRLDLFTGLLGCFVGIFLGDLGLFLLGFCLRQFSRVSLFKKIIAGRFAGDRLDKLRARFEREGWKLVFLSRFLPGTRFPVYVGAGMLGGGAARLIVIALIAGLVWTPLIVILTFALGASAMKPLIYLFGEGWLALVAGALLIFLALRVAGKLFRRRGRQQLRAWLDRWRRPEFWSPKVLYAPLVPLCLYLHARYRGFGTLCASNPMIEPCGGFFGESKSEILSKLPADAILDYFLIEPGPVEERLARFENELERTGLGYPVVLKPDTGEVGIGMRIVRDRAGAGDYLAEFPEALIAQRYHAGPYEVGVFYVRMPNEEHGGIFSITHKEFQSITGDGRTRLSDLIWDHPRYRHQAAVFEARHRKRWDEVLPAGEELVLARAGNHYQGTLFRDGEHWRTPELEARIDQISRRIKGFYFGRYDLRFGDESEFRAGRDIAIVELNLSSAESTNMYDPDKGIVFLYRTLFRQWITLFEVGDASRRLHGIKTPGMIGLIRAMLAYVRQRKKVLVAD